MSMLTFFNSSNSYLDKESWFVKVLQTVIWDLDRISSSSSGVVIDLVPVTAVKRSEHVEHAEVGLLFKEGYLDGCCDKPLCLSSLN